MGSSGRFRPSGLAKHEGQGGDDLCLRQLAPSDLGNDETQQREAINGVKSSRRILSRLLAQFYARPMPRSPQVTRNEL